MCAPKLKIIVCSSNTGAQTQGTQNPPAHVPNLSSPPKGEKSRAQLFQEGPWFADALRACYSNLSNQLLWIGLLPAQRTAAVIFRAIARVAAAIYDLLVIRLRRFPLQLHRLGQGTQDDQDIAEAELLSTEDCMLDDFSLYVKQRLVDLEGDAKANFLVLVSECVQMITCTTYHTERLHSQNLRKVLSRKMTHGVDVATLAALQMGKTVPDRFQGLLKDPAEANLNTTRPRQASST